MLNLFWNTKTDLVEYSCNLLLSLGREETTCAGGCPEYHSKLADAPVAVECNLWGLWGGTPEDCKGVSEVLPAEFVAAVRAGGDAELRG